MMLWSKLLALDNNDRGCSIDESKAIKLVNEVLSQEWRSNFDGALLNGVGCTAEVLEIELFMLPLHGCYALNAILFD